MKTITNRFPGHCAQCSALVPGGAGLAARAGNISARTGKQRWLTFCTQYHLDTFTGGAAANQEEDRDMNTQEMLDAVGYEHGSLPASAPVSGKRRVALRSYARSHGLPGAFTNSGKVTSEQLRALWNSNTPTTDALALLNTLQNAPEPLPASAPEPLPVSGGFGPMSGNSAAPAPVSIPAPAPAPMVAPVALNSGATPGEMLAAAIQAIAAASAGSVKPEEVREIVRAEIAGLSAPRMVEVKITGAIVASLPAAARHAVFPKVLAALGCKENVLLVGPAGSGKTTLAEQCAEALGVPFSFTGAIDTEYKLSGFMNANGVYVSTLFRQAYENGGLFLFDEIDASLPGALMWFNAALANGVCPFPDGMVKRHENFYCIAAANTFGHGNSRQYVGRNQQDAAALDRFTNVAMNYDTDLELLIAGDTAWTRHVQKVRAIVESLNSRTVISPRASIRGNKLLAAGLDWPEVEEMTLFAAMDKDAKSKVHAAIGQHRAAA